MSLNEQPEKKKTARELQSADVAAAVVAERNRCLRIVNEIAATVDGAEYRAVIEINRRIGSGE